MNQGSPKSAHITLDEHISPAEKRMLGNKLLQFNNRHIEGSLFEPEGNVSAALRDASGTLVGGIDCEMYLYCLYIDRLWIDQRLRGQGFGRKLLDHAEQMAKSLGCTFVHTTTYNFQAPEFYQQAGYQIFAELDDFLDGIKLFYLKKPLT